VAVGDVDVGSIDDTQALLRGEAATWVTLDSVRTG
jgi:hypothetical protein